MVMMMQVHGRSTNSVSTTAAAAPTFSIRGVHLGCVRPCYLVFCFRTHPFHICGRVWDRGALVALRPEDREEYVRVCDSVLAPGGKVLLATMVYDQSAKNGADYFSSCSRNCCVLNKKASVDLRQTKRSSSRLERLDPTTDLDEMFMGNEK